LIAAANVNPPRPKEYFFRETLSLQAGPDEVKIEGHSFPSTAQVPKAVYSLRYSYSWTDAPISKVELDFDDFSRRFTVTGTAADQVDAISAALERDLSHHSAIGGYTLRSLAVVFTSIILLSVLLVSGAFCVSERQWRFLGIPIFSLLGLVLLLNLPLEDLLAGFALYQGESSWIVRYEPEMALAGLMLTIVGIALSFLIPASRERAPEKEGVEVELPESSPEGSARRKQLHNKKREAAGIPPG
jgi:hypothetical protein